MNFLYIVGFDVPPQKEREFQKWVQANSQAFHEALPEGLALLGIYSDIFSSEKESGRYKLMVRMDSYGAIDRLAASNNPKLAQLLKELGDFNDVRIGAHSSSSLMKTVADIVIWEDYSE